MEVDIGFLNRYEPVILNTSKGGLVRFDVEAHRINIEKIRGAEYKLRSSLVKTIDQKILERVKNLREKFLNNVIKKSLGLPFLALPDLPKIEIPRVLKIPEFKDIRRIYPEITEEEMMDMKKANYRFSLNLLEPLADYIEELRSTIEGGSYSKTNPIAFATSLTKEKTKTFADHLCGYINSETGEIFSNGLKLLDIVLPQKQKAGEPKLEYAATFGNPVYATVIQTDKLYISAGPTSQYFGEALKEVEPQVVDNITSNFGEGKRMVNAKLPKVLKIASTYISD
jgi:hypothetical protein